MDILKWIYFVNTIFKKSYEIPKILISNVIQHNSSYLKMLCVTEITKFLCQLHYNELSSYLQPLAFFKSFPNYSQLLFYSDAFAKTLSLQEDS